MKYAIYKMYVRKAPEVIEVFQKKYDAAVALEKLYTNPNWKIIGVSYWKINKYLRIYDASTFNYIYVVDTYPERTLFIK